MFIEKLRNLWAKTRNTPRDSDDAGFSFAQVIVTMVIVGILGGAIGFTAFQFIGQSRETVLAANIRTAADAVQNTLALNPDLRGGVTAATGAPSTSLISELSNTAGFTWSPGTYAWAFQSGDDVEIVRIQMIDKGAAGGVGLTTPTGAATTPPAVRWLVDDWDAVRVQIRNGDGAWACALIVLRPDWTKGIAGTAATTTPDQELEAEGNLRGVWYDAGSNIPSDNGLHHCSPATIADEDLQAAYGITTAVATAGANDPLPASGSEWTIPYTSGPAAAAALNADTTTATTDDIIGRWLQRSVPDFAAN